MADCQEDRREGKVAGQQQYRKYLMLPRTGFIRLGRNEVYAKSALAKTIGNHRDSIRSRIQSVSSRSQRASEEKRPKERDADAADLPDRKCGTARNDPLLDRVHGADYVCHR